jgi:hypothetical protein
VLVEALPQSPPRDGQGLAGVPTLLLYGRESRVRLQVEVLVFEPAYPLALRTPLLALEIPAPNGPLTPAPRLRDLRLAALGVRNVSPAAGDGSGEEFPETAGGLAGRLMLGLPGGGYSEGSPASSP